MYYPRNKSLGVDKEPYKNQIIYVMQLCFAFVSPLYESSTQSCCHDRAICFCIRPEARGWALWSSNLIELNKLLSECYFDLQVAALNFRGNILLRVDRLSPDVNCNKDRSCRRFVFFWKAENIKCSLRQISKWLGWKNFKITHSL